MKIPQKTILWVVGEPGIGKTTLCRKLFARFDGKPNEDSCWTDFTGPLLSCAAVGSWRGDKFDGGDRVPPSLIKQATAELEEHLNRTLCVFDGDKFANMNAVRAVQEILAAQPDRHYYRIVCVYMFGERAAAEGRASRGTNQNASWIKGRRTKCDRFVEAFREAGGEVIPIDRNTCPDPFDHVKQLAP